MLNAKLLNILACPLTKRPLSYDEENGELISADAGLAYPVRSGIPIMLVEEARIIDEEKAMQFQHLVSRQSE